MQGLLATAQHKKQAEFLGRSFDSETDRAAAAKNAFVLLAQHRPQLAAAFFILGEASCSLPVAAGGNAVISLYIPMEAAGFCTLKMGQS